MFGKIIGSVRSAYRSLMNWIKRPGLDTLIAGTAGTAVFVITIGAMAAFSAISGGHVLGGMLVLTAVGVSTIVAFHSMVHLFATMRAQTMLMHMDFASIFNQRIPA